MTLFMNGVLKNNITFPRNRSSSMSFRRNLFNDCDKEFEQFVVTY